MITTEQLKAVANEINSTWTPGWSAEQTESGVAVSFNGKEVMWCDNSGRISSSDFVSEDEKESFDHAINYAY